MRVIYIAGKYSGSCDNEVFENIIVARTAARRLWSKGWAVICPHTNSMFMDWDDDGNIFIEGDLEFIRRVDAIYMLSNYKDSPGALKELELAESLGLEIIYEGE